jgi:hypothetical protein
VPSDVVGQPGHLAVPDDGGVDPGLLVLDDLEVESEGVGSIE